MQQWFSGTELRRRLEQAFSLAYHEYDIMNHNSGMLPFDLAAFFG